MNVSEFDLLLISGSRSWWISITIVYSCLYSSCLQEQCRLFGSKLLVHWECNLMDVWLISLIICLKILFSTLRRIFLLLNTGGKTVFPHQYVLWPSEFSLPSEMFSGFAQFLSDESTTLTSESPWCRRRRRRVRHSNCNRENIGSTIFNDITSKSPIQGDSGSGTNLQHFVSDQNDAVYLHQVLHYFPTVTSASQLCCLFPVFQTESLTCYGIAAWACHWVTDLDSALCAFARSLLTRPVILTEMALVYFLFPISWLFILV